MYLDETIVLGELPQKLVDMMNIVDNHYYGNDETFFYARLDEVEAIAKQACLDNLITDRQLNAIFERYGLR